MNSIMQINSEDDCVRHNLPHFRPVTPPHVKELDGLNSLVPFNVDAALAFPSKPVSRINAAAASLIDRQRSISGMAGVKTVSVDSIGAQHAASALVTNNLMDIFGK